MPNFVNKQPFLSDFKTLKIQLHWLIMNTLKIIRGMQIASLQPQIFL